MSCMLAESDSLGYRLGVPCLRSRCFRGRSCLLAELDLSRCRRWRRGRLGSVDVEILSITTVGVFGLAVSRLDSRLL